MHTPWNARNKCLLYSSVPVKYHLLFFCLECTCALDKAHGPYILGKDYWRRTAIFAKDSTEKVKHGLDGRYNPSSFWDCESWAWIPQPRDTRCSCHVETLRNLDILKTRWPCVPQGEPQRGKLSYTFSSVLDSQSSPRCL